MFVALDAGRVAFVLDDGRRVLIEGDDGVAIWRDRFLRLERLLGGGGTARIEELEAEVDCGDCTAMAQALEYARRYREMEREVAMAEAVADAEKILNRSRA